MVPDFADYLSKMLTARGLSKRAFATRAGMDPAYLVRVLQREKPVPSERIDAMAEALELSGEEREEFLTCAHLSIATTYLQRLFAQMQTELMALRGKSSHGHGGGGGDGGGLPPSPCASK